MATSTEPLEICAILCNTSESHNITVQSILCTLKLLILLIHIVWLCNFIEYNVEFIYVCLCMCVCERQYGCIKLSHYLSFNHFYVKMVSVSFRYFEMYAMLLLIVFTLLCSRSHDLYPWINKCHFFPPSLLALTAIILPASVSSASLDSIQWDGVQLVFLWL